jgi:hypothetical protein
MIMLKIQLLESTPLDLSFHSLIPKIKQPSSFPSPSATINNNKEVAPTNPMVDSFTANRSSAVPSYQQGILCSMSSPKIQQLKPLHIMT